MTSKEIGQIIKNNRKSKNITQQALADKCEMSRSHLADVEAGRNSPSAILIIKIFRILDIDLNLLKNMNVNLGENKHEKAVKVIGNYKFSYSKFEKLLNEQCITAYQVSKDTGITTATLSEWKTGKYTPKIDKLLKLANYFGITVEYFLEEKVNQNANEVNILDKIKVLCNRNNISLTQLEKNLNFSSGILCKWANHSPSVKALKSVSTYFNVSIEYFLDEKTNINNLKAIREDRQLGVNELSRMSGVNKSTISEIENNIIKNSSLDTIRSLIKALNVSFDELFPDSEDNSKNLKFNLSNVSTNDLLEEIKRRCENERINN